MSNFCQIILPRNNFKLTKVHTTENARLPLKLRVLLNLVLLTWPSLRREILRAIDAETKISLSWGKILLTKSDGRLSISFTL